MSARNLRRILLLVFLGSLLVQPAEAQLTLSHDVIGSGGGSSSSASLYLDDTAGEAVIGVLNSGPNIHEVGYQYVLKTFFAQYVSVAITAFNAHYTEEGVRLEWEIGFAEGLEGFNVYRAKGASGEFTRLNNELISIEKEYTYLDNRIRPGVSYAYHIGAVDSDGEFFSPTLSVNVPSWETTLDQNYPNPFNPSTIIPFSLAAPSPVSLTIYNVKGQRVKTLLNETKDFGRYKINWDGKNDHGLRVSSGVYYYRLEAGKHVFTKKLVLLK